MTVLIAEDVPPAVRGLLRRWFVEPRPNVFVGSQNARTRDRVIQYIRRNAPDMHMLVIDDSNVCQGYRINMYGYPSRQLIECCGLQLIREDSTG